MGVPVPVTTDLDVRLAELEKQQLADLWKLHRKSCLELAVKLGATTAEQAIEIAEKFDVYIRIGRHEGGQS